MHMITEAEVEPATGVTRKMIRVSGDFRMNSKDVESGFRTRWKRRAGQNKIIIAIAHWKEPCITRCFCHIIK